MFVWLLPVFLAACSSTASAPSALSQPTSAQVSSTTSSTAKFPSTLVVSVTYFDDRTGRADLAWMRKGLSDMLVAELARVPSVLVVQRQRLEEVVREQALQLSGRVADESAVRVGRLAGATILVSGSVAVADGRLRIDAQMLGVEQGAILGTAVAEGRLTEVSAVARALVGKVAQLLPDTGYRQSETSVTTEPSSGFVPAAKANDAGETFSREGKVFQALGEYERALAADPTHSVARANYAETIRSLSGQDLLNAGQAGGGMANDRLVVARLVERLAGMGLEAETGQPRSEGGTNGWFTLRVPVQLRLAPSAVEVLRESAQSLGGSVGPAGGASGAIEAVLSSRSEVNRDFVRQVAAPRRAYLRLLSAEGRTIAVYSGLHEWRPSDWVLPVDDQRVRIESGKVLSTEGVFTGLTAEQVAAVAGVKVTIESVPRERATVSLDVSAVEGQATRDRGRRKAAEAQESGPPGAKSLRAMMERAWNPPVTERPWGRGYLPSNERDVVVAAVLEGGRPVFRQEPHLVHPSGDAEFDAAALEAAKIGFQRWLAEAAQGASANGSDFGPAKKDQAWTFRAQFKLIKDMPALNLIGPIGSSAQGFPSGQYLGPSSKIR